MGPGYTSSSPQFYVFIDYVMLHEFGHTLGLPDFYSGSTSENYDSRLSLLTAIMNKYWVAKEIKDEDIEQLRAIYGLHTKH